MVFTRLTTKDNPYDPFDQFDKWFEFDSMKGYNSCSLLARLAKTSEGSSLYVNEMLNAEAIDTICAWMPEIYTKVERNYDSETDEVIVIPS